MHNLETRTFPPRLAELGFEVQLPRDWISHDLPPEELDFEDSTKFAPLAVVTAPHAALVFAFAARPAYGDGTLHDWALFLLNHNQLKPRTLGVHQVGNIPAIVGEAEQESELGPMLVRFAFFEDGQRLLNLTLTAPELLADAVRAIWFSALESFALSSPRGATVAVQAEATAPAPGSSEMAEAAGASSGGGAAHALADDAASLDPEHPSNVDHCNHGPSPAPTARRDGQPEWWHRALALEAAGRFEEAEETITKGANHIGGVASVAQMYAERMIRLQDAGDAAGALDAFKRADQWICHYASLATSGGEGAALSLERDQFRARLVNAFGGDPTENQA